LNSFKHMKEIILIRLIFQTLIDGKNNSGIPDFVNSVYSYLSCKFQFSSTTFHKRYSYLDLYLEIQQHFSSTNCPPLTFMKRYSYMDLVPLPQEARVSHDGEAFADHVEEFTSE
jgi:hypothetical protein